MSVQQRWVRYYGDGKVASITDMQVKACFMLYNVQVWDDCIILHRKLDSLYAGYIIVKALINYRDDYPNGSR